jgi:hypothetical protein
MEVLILKELACTKTVHPWEVPSGRLGANLTAWRAGA